MLRQPTKCDPRAFKLLSEQLPHLESTDGLWRAATAIAMHALDDADIVAVERRFNQLAERVLAGCRSGKDEAKLAHLHSVLFDQEEFSGNLDDYYSPINSYLPVVLESRRGLPIILALIYKVVACRVGLQAQGINSPGHFLVRVKVDNRWLIVDPFFRGQLLTQEEALERLQLATNGDFQGLQISDALTSASHQQWLIRILNNLQVSLANLSYESDLAAMRELRLLLDSPEE